jgi:hypothetical protein
MYYKYFEVFMHGRDPIIVTGRTRAEVGRDFKKIYGPDKVDEVKPLSVRGAEARLGLDFKQIVKSNTMVNTPSGKEPRINEQMETKDYAFYEVSFVGTDETDIIIGSSLESVQADMEELYGDNLLSVEAIQPEELAPAPDEDEPKRQHANNISILTGRNPFSESLEEKKGPCWSGYKKVPGKKDYEDGSCVKEDEELEEVSSVATTAPKNPQAKSTMFSKAKSKISARRASNTIDRKNDGRMGMQTEETLDEVSIEKATRAYAARKSQAQAAAHRDSKDYAKKQMAKARKTKAYIDKRESVNEVSIERAKAVRDRGFDRMAKAAFKTGDMEDGHKAAKAAGLATKTIQKNKNKAKTGRYEAYGVSITSDMSIEEQSALIKMLPSTMQIEAMEALGLEEKRGLWDNIHAKRKRIKNGSGERMRKPGSKGAPTAQDFKDSQTKK